MKGDFSRDTFNPHKHFSRVLQQQGRVQLDADTNEQTEILLHYLRTLAADLIGPFAGPVGDGFKISEGENGNNDLIIGKGRYYVDGILCENEENITYKNQPDYPNPLDLTSISKLYLVYLDVWERHITALEDDDIREKALGGSDTATRTKIVWQVKVDEGDQKNGSSMIISQADIHKSWEAWQERWQPSNRGRLRARVKPSENSIEPCLIAPDAKYRGQENQLYRVEIHQSGSANEGDKNNGATFKWSRDNGTVVTGCTKKGKELIVNNPRGFTAPGWVELTSEEQELRGEHGAFAKIIKSESDVLTLENEPDIPKNLSSGEKWPTKVRYWESDALSVREGAGENADWIDLKYGVQIQFQQGENHQYRTGDYWLIPARVMTGDIEYPDEAQPPHGIDHHYAPLAIIESNGNTSDLRFQFESLGKRLKKK